MTRIGILATLIGPYRIMGEDAVRGAQLALAEFDYRAADEPVELVIRETNAIGDSARDGATALLFDEGCDLIVGPLSGDEGIAIRAFAREHPQYTFINGTSASQAIFDPAPNYYSFSGSGAQWMAGFGRYCYEVKGYRRIVTIGESYSFPFAQVGGFSLEFCRAGGSIADMLWCSLGTEDFSGFIDQIPGDVDAVLSVLAGMDSVNFIRQYRDQRGDSPMIAGQASGDAGTLSLLGDYAELMAGVLVASPVADVNSEPLWPTFVDAYCASYPEGFYSPSEPCVAYYTAVKAALLALEAVNADLSDGQANYRELLSALAFETPTGPVCVDHNNLAIITNFVSEIKVSAKGSLYTEMLVKVPEVNCTLGLPEDEYRRIGNFSLHNMPCGPGQQVGGSFSERLQQQRRNRLQD